ncbi:MAG: NAD-dependent epimerase/dehydratase family protein [Actinobacteria bacterium]|nr:NAD-dependent epimerase/dehydratase family protein [Actinomycetota bacterium]MBV9255826.1 NAD-dependent epimerase/dehydratase family protein [Actinomycetota bacterium]
MNVLVLGGTRFIGRAITEELVAAGHAVTVVHRGTTEPDGWVDVDHVHVARTELASVAEELRDRAPDAVVDCIAMTKADAHAAASLFGDDVRLLVLSSVDVYESYGALQEGRVGEPVPVFEDSPVRDKRYPYRGVIDGMDDYEKLDVEEVYLARGGTVLRLPMVYGEHDGQRREWPILRRVHAGRDRIPFGAGTWVTSRGYVRDIGTGVRLALESDRSAGEVFNLAEARSPSVELWARWILDAAGSHAELVRVPDDQLPDDLGITSAIGQHLTCDSSKARTVLGWTETALADAMRRSVTWHLANPPTEAETFEVDDRALATAERNGEP